MPNRSLDLIHTVGQLLRQLAFWDHSKESPTDFTRDRKIEFLGVLSMVLNQVRPTTQIAWDDFRERLLPVQADCTTYTREMLNNSKSTEEIICEP